MNRFQSRVAGSPEGAHLFRSWLLEVCMLRVVVLTLLMSLAAGLQAEYIQVSSCGGVYAVRPA